MIASIERLRRVATNPVIVPSMLLVISISVAPDPARRNTGYGGVLPVPAPVPSAPTSSTRADAVTEQQQRDLRAARGRVLYADGRGGQSAATAQRAIAHKAPCPERRVVQIRTPNSSPNS